MPTPQPRQHTFGDERVCPMITKTAFKKSKLFPNESPSRVY